MRLNTVDYKNWAFSQWMEYASRMYPSKIADTFSKSALLTKLTFSVNLDKEYKVTLGNKVLYLGPDLDHAILEFNKISEKYT